MNPLDNPYFHHLHAAAGWLELGNSREAHAELESIDPNLRAHPDVLEMRWLIYATEEKWNVCKDIAFMVTQKAPERVSGWVQLAYSMRRGEGGSIEAAQEILLKAVAIFPDELIIHFNLACYAFQLGNKDEARTRLKKSLSLGDPKNVKFMVREDADLDPLWRDIAEP